MKTKLILLLIPLFFALSCSKDSLENEETYSYRLYTPKRAYLDVVRPFDELGSLMCADIVPVKTIDSLFHLMNTKDTRDSLFQVNLFVYDEQQIISRTLHPARNLGKHFIEYEHRSTNDGHDDCVMAWQETYSIQTKGKISDNTTYYIYRQVAISDFQKAIVEIMIEEG